jgi:FRG domain-containing protein
MPILRSIKASPARSPSPAGSISEFLDRVSGIHRKWFDGNRFWQPWFRGLGDVIWKLQPRLFRLKREISQLLDEEEELRSEFRRRGMQLISGERPPQSDFEWYFLMQHHGVHTRLLDWTDGALTALYFAVEPFVQRERERNDAVVWMLDPSWLNDQTFKKRDESEGVALPEWDLSKEYLPEIFEDRKLRRTLPIAIDPSHISRRVAVQRSRFVIFGNRRDGLMEVARATRNPRLVKIPIAFDAIRPIQKQLETCGITRATVFPELDGLSRELRRIMQQSVSSLK